jgi:RHS repeat-associated protein
MIRIADPQPAPDPLFAYTGRDFDSEVGLQSNQLRRFDPTVGRWLNDARVCNQGRGVR